MFRNTFSAVIRKFSRFSQFLKFFVIWGVAAFADLAILAILTETFHVYYLHSVVIGFTIVTTAAFFVHKRVTFRCARSDRIRQYSIFVAVNVIGLSAYSGLMWVGVERFHFYYLAVAFVSKFIIFVWNFLANKYVTFRPHHAI